MRNYTDVAAEPAKESSASEEQKVLIWGFLSELQTGNWPFIQWQVLQSDILITQGVIEQEKREIEALKSTLMKVIDLGS